MSHAISQMNPSAPVAMNAARHPHVSAIHGTMIGVMIAPTFEPALKMPVANARSRDGNHSATVLIDAGKVARLAEAEREARDAESGAPSARAPCAIADRLQTTIEPANPRRVPKRSMIRPANRKPSA